MTLREKTAGLAGALAHPKTTVRWRLTLLYGGLFLASGAALLATTYTLISHTTVDTTVANSSSIQQAVGGGGRPEAGAALRSPTNLASAPPVPSQVRRLLGTPAGQVAARIVGSDQRIADLHQLEVESGIALAIMAILSTLLGWAVAGRVLRPLRTMTATTQQISEANLNERLAMQGPPDELRKLADTIDGLLERLERAFDAQRRFVANASHELRTPLTAAQALLEMITSDPDATVESFRDTCKQVLEESEQQEQLIDALLALAQGQRGIDQRELIDLADITGDVLRTLEQDAAERGLALDASLEPAVLAGDRRLIQQLVSNLLENALRYNDPHGQVRVLVEARAGAATLAIANTGPPVPAHELDRLLQPFQRLAPDRVGHREGLGLGLSIVAAIVGTHDAALDVHPGTDGGLQIEVRFPPQLTAPAPAGAVSSEPSRA